MYHKNIPHPYDELPCSQGKSNLLFGHEGLFKQANDELFAGHKPTDVCKKIRHLTLKSICGVQADPRQLQMFVAPLVDDIIRPQELP